MIYRRVQPASQLRQFIECYWLVENDDPTPVTQKIIPDGFTEMIFDYRDAYRICLNGVWKGQTKQLFAGQIKSHFFLENTGPAGMIGVKFKPAALTHWFGVDMSIYTDKVVDAYEVPGIPRQLIDELMNITSSGNHDFIITKFDEVLIEFSKNVMIRDFTIDKAIELIFEKKGLVNVQDISKHANIGERQLERIFKKYIGLSPKFYARIIRFSYIFELVKEENPHLTEIAYEAGYFDQSHFIKNFKAFTGEDPSKYQFFEKTFANFFLKR